jgi:hypothetical protein
MRLTDHLSNGAWAQCFRQGRRRFGIKQIAHGKVILT